MRLVKAEKEQFHCHGHNATSIIAFAKICYVLTFHFNTKSVTLSKKFLGHLPSHLHKAKANCKYARTR